MQVKLAIEQFDLSLRGRLIQPDDRDYDSARRIWNGLIDLRPLMIVQCQSASDVIKAVNFARENNLFISVKGGGHNVAVKPVYDYDNVMVIDLSLMNTVWIEPEKQIVHVGPGATLGDIDHVIQTFGLATTAGIVSKTGIVGLTLGGGLGFLARRCVLSMDNLISADVITAKGELVQASEKENSDVFRGLQDGGDNFGIVTSFEFRMHKVGSKVLTAQIYYPIENAEKVLLSYRKLMSFAPEELTCYSLAVNIPPLASFPADYHGKSAIALLACYSGDIEEGKKLLKSLQKTGKPVLEVIGPMPYVMLQQQNSHAGKPRYYWKSHFMNGITDNAIDTFIRFTNPLPGPLTIAGFEPIGGAISRFDLAATAFPFRNAKYAFGIWSSWNDASTAGDHIINWTREFHEAMAPFSNGNTYTNYLD